MKWLLLAASIVALAAGGAFAQGLNSAPSDTPRSLSPSSPSTSAPSARTLSAAPGASSSTTSSSAASGAQASPDEVIKAQEALRQQGLYKGPVDGKFGPETRSAVSRFQKQNGLQQSAQLDQPTMNNLEGSGTGSSTQTPGNSSLPGQGTSGTDKDDDFDKN